MSKKAFIVVGSWNFRASEKGITVFEYDIDSGEARNARHYDGEITAGAQFYDSRRNILYIVDECEGPGDAAGGGGFVRAYDVDRQSGELSLINTRCVFMTKPAYFWLDPSGDYGLVAAHSGRACVTRVVRGPEGKYSSQVLYDDAGIALLRINPDGGLGEVCDTALYDGLTPNRIQVHSHPHSIVGSPSGEIYYACDKGLDMIYSYKIDRSAGRLVPLAEKKMKYATAPRYSAFHPELKVLYENNETSNDLFAFNYNEETGELETAAAVELCSGSSDKIRPSDLVVDSRGRFLYAAVRGINRIAVFSLDPGTGIPSRIQEADDPGGPRGLCISPDGRFLFAADNDSSAVKKFRIMDDGTLEDSGSSFPAREAANIGFIVFE